MRKLVKQLKQLKQPKVPDTLAIEYVDVDSLHPWSHNPRRNDVAAKDVAESIKLHGFRSPLVCWKPGRRILKGHATWKAAQLLKLKQVPVVWAPFKSERQADMYALRDNRSAELAEWDQDLLAEVLAERKEVSIEKMSELSGFQVQEIKGLREGWELQQEFAPDKSQTPLDQVEQRKPTSHVCPECGHEFTN